MGIRVQPMRLFNFLSIFLHRSTKTRYWPVAILSYISLSYEENNLFLLHWEGPPGSGKGGKRGARSLKERVRYVAPNESKVWRRLVRRLVLDDDFPSGM